MGELMEGLQRPIIPRVRNFLLIMALAALAGCSKPADRPGMVRIDGGEFYMGTDHGFPYEGPPHRVRLDGYFLDETEVTNEQFAAFVRRSFFARRTRHYTQARRKRKPGRELGGI